MAMSPWYVCLPLCAVGDFCNREGDLVWCAWCVCAGEQVEQNASCAGRGTYSLGGAECFLRKC